MVSDITKWVNTVYKAAAKDAKKMISEGYDTLPIVNEIISIQERLAIERIVTEGDIVQHLAIKIIREEKRT